MFTVLIFQYSSSIFTRALETAVKASSTVTNRIFFPSFLCGPLKGLKPKVN